VKVICLGTGTSHGVPMIACDCEVCTSEDPKDKRSRPSIVVQFDNQHVILIDTSPDIRIQCVDNNIRRVDAVLYTHHHADHVVGLDDVRRFNAVQRAEIPVYGSAGTMAEIRKMFDYAFTPDSDYPSFKPMLRIELIDGPWEMFGQRIVPILLMHGPLPILGFRFGKFAYCTDCSHVPDESVELLAGLDMLILDGLRHKPHPTHMTVAQAVDMAGRIGAKQTYLTHIAHELPHAATNAGLPPEVQLAHDGLTIEVD
jgi:phosphoribosyl 1,2-cyclic phosphate phosphodiesterase